MEPSQATTILNPKYRNYSFFYLILIFIAVAIIYSIPSKGQNPVFERADFFINANECVNCQAFIKNYVITYQNSDTLYLHLDQSVENFGEEYIRNKGIDPSGFDRIFYENLLEQNNGYFDSYVLIKNENKTDSLLLKNPLLLYNTSKETALKKTNLSHNCGKTSNRVFSYYNSEHFVLVDYLLKKTLFYTTTNDSISSCESDYFGISQSGAAYKKWISDAGYSLDLTDGIRNILFQLGKDKPIIESIAVGSKNNFAAITNYPIALHDAKGDTAIKNIQFLQDEGGKISGIISAPNHVPLPDSLNFNCFTLFGAGRDGKNQLYIPLIKEEGNYQKGDQLIAILKRNKTEKFYQFNNFLDFKMPKNGDARYEALRFSAHLIYFKSRPYFYDVRKGLTYEINLDLKEHQKFILYSVTPAGNDPALYKLCYKIDDVLTVSTYDTSIRKNIISTRYSMKQGSFPIAQAKSIFILQKGGPSLPYKVLSF